MTDRRAGWAALAALALLLVFAFRVVSIDTTYMRDDEEIAFRTTARGLDFAVRYQAEQDVHAPVWFASFWAWQQVAGSIEFTARIYSILLSTLALALLYQIGRRWFGHPRYGVFAVAVAGVNAYAHIYSLEIRPYALGMLLAAANMLLFRRWFVRPTWRRALVYGASVALMMWTHYFLAFQVMAQAVVVVSVAAFQTLRARRRDEQTNRARHVVPKGGFALPLHGDSASSAFANGGEADSQIVQRSLTKRRLAQGVGAAVVALLLWLPWLPVFVGQVQTLRDIETRTGAFRGLGIGNTTAVTSLETVWQQVLLMTNGQPLLYALPVVAGLFLARRRSYALALAWALGVPAINLLVNLIASVYTPRYLSYTSLGVALAVGVGLAALPRFRWATLALFCAVSLWALPSQFPTDRIPYRDILQAVSARAEPGDAVYFTRADDADLFTRWQIDHYLAPALRANELPDFAAASEAHSLWFITGDYFNPEVEARFRALERTRPQQDVAGECNPRWCWLALRLGGAPEAEPVLFGDALNFYGVDALRVDEDGVSARLWWQANAPVEADYSISLQLLNTDGVLVAQSDGPLNPNGETPTQTSQLEPGRMTVDARRLATATPLAPGTYALVLVVYQPWDDVRLTLQNGSDTLHLRAVTVP